MNFPEGVGCVNDFLSYRHLRLALFHNYFKVDSSDPGVVFLVDDVLGPEFALDIDQHSRGQISKLNPHQGPGNERYVGNLC